MMDALLWVIVSGIRHRWNIPLPIAKECTSKGWNFLAVVPVYEFGRIQLSRLDSDFSFEILIKYPPLNVQNER